MKIRELKELLNKCNDDFEIYMTNEKGELVTENIKVKQIFGSKRNSYIIEIQ